jgi:hypothetical protein
MYQVPAVQPGQQHCLQQQHQQRQEHQQRQQQWLASDVLLGGSSPDSPSATYQLTGGTSNSHCLQMGLLETRQLPASCHPDVAAALEQLADELTDGWQDPTPTDYELRLALEYQLHRAGSLPEAPQEQQHLQQHSTSEDAHSAPSKSCGQQTLCSSNLGQQHPAGPWQPQLNLVQQQQQLEQQQLQQQQQQQDEQQPGSEGAPAAWAATLLQCADAAGSAGEVFAGLNQLLDNKINCCAAAGNGSGSNSRHSSGEHQQQAQQWLLRPSGCSDLVSDAAPGMAGSSDQQYCALIANAAAAGNVQPTIATAFGMLPQQQTCVQQHMAVSEFPLAVAAAASACYVPPVGAGLGGNLADQQQQQQQQLMAAVVVSEMGTEHCTAGSLGPHLSEFGGLPHCTDALQRSLTDVRQQQQQQQLHKRRWHSILCQQQQQQQCAAYMQLTSRKTSASKCVRPPSAAANLHKSRSIGSSRSGSSSQPQQKRRAATFDMGPQQRRIQQEMLKKEQRREKRRQHQHQQKQLPVDEEVA